MSVIEAPTRRQTVIKVEENEVQKKIGEMIFYVKSGKWCRDTTDDSHGRHCALGLVNRVAIGSNHIMFSGIYDALDWAIPEDEQRYMTALRPGRVINGGTVRGTGDVTQRIATYNNISEGPDQVVEWFERARLLA